VSTFSFFLSKQCFVAGLTNVVCKRLLRDAELLEAKLSKVNVGADELGTHLVNIVEAVRFPVKGKHERDTQT
jgi:hypothetical protein